MTIQNGYILQESNYLIFWKRQNHGADNTKINDLAIIELGRLLSRRYTKDLSKVENHIMVLEGCIHLAIFLNPQTQM